MSQRLVDILAGIGLLAVVAAFYSQTVGQFADAPVARNPMAVPRFLLVLLGLGAAGLVLRGLVFRKTTTERQSGAPAAPDLAWKKCGLMALAALAYLLCFQPLGFILSSAIFLPVAITMLGYRRPSVIALVTVIAVPLLWWLFADVFFIRPPGIGFDDLYRSLAGNG